MDISKFMTPTLWATMLFYTEFIKLKNHTHVKVGHTSGFPFGIYWWTVKNPKNQNFEKMKTKLLEIYIILHVYQKPQPYEVQFLRYGVRQTFWSFWAFFCTLTPNPPKNAENQNFEKLKKESGDVIILNLCNKKRNHMIYAYSDMKCDAHNFFAILGHFLLFYHTIDPEN